MAKTNGCVGKSSILAYFQTPNLLSTDEWLRRYGGLKMMLLGRLFIVYGSRGVFRFCNGFSGRFHVLVRTCDVMVEESEISSSTLPLGYPDCSYRDISD